MSGRHRLVARGVVVALLLAALAAYFLFGGRELFTLDALKDQRATLMAELTQAPVRVALIYVGLYAVLLALALPVAGLLTLAGGALFGWWKGALLASIAATVGATLCMLGARLLARDWIRARWPRTVARIERGVERSGGTYLVSLRLAPAIPFVLINVAMGLTGMRPGRFALLTFASGFPGALAFAYAGQEIARIDSLDDVLTPGLLIAFLSLAALPLIGKAVANWLRR